MKTNGMEIFNREAFLSKLRRKVVKVEVKEWGGYVFLRQLGGEDMGLIQNAAKTVDAQDVLQNLKFGAELISKSVCDEAGALMLKPEEVDEIVKDCSPAELQAIVKQILDVNGWSRMAQETLEKNSATGPSAGSASA